MDEGWDTEDIRKLAISLRNLETEDVTDDGQSIVVLDEKQSKVLWRSVGNDRVSTYVRTYGAESGVLGDPETVG